jgi:hypothetical protein
LHVACSSTATVAQSTCSLVKPAQWREWGCLQRSPSQQGRALGASQASRYQRAKRHVGVRWGGRASFRSVTTARCANARTHTHTHTHTTHTNTHTHTHTHTHHTHKHTHTHTHTPHTQTHVRAPHACAHTRPRGASCALPHGGRVPREHRRLVAQIQAGRRPPRRRARRRARQEEPWQGPLCEL